MAESRLSITIDSQSAEQRAEALARKLDAVERSGERVTQSFKGTSAELRAQKDDLGRLLGQIDPVVGRLGQLDKMEQQLRKHHRQGILPTDDFNEYKKKLDASREALGGFDGQMRRAGNTAGQTRQALNQLPMQFTDIWVSLAAGQNPMTVFIQQGTQIKDSFGGAGPALKAFGGYVLGLVNPLTVTIGTLGALAVAAYKGADEAEEFGKSLAITGNVAGTTVDKLSALSAELDSMAGITRGQAAAALNEVVRSGKLTSDQFEMVTRAALQMQQATGQAISETVGEFAKIADDPVSAIKELNEQYHFLTAAQYENITALSQSGNQTDAVRVAMDLFADTMETRSADVNRNLGTIEKGWRLVADAARDFFDAAKELGRDSYQRQLEQAQAELSQLSEGNGLLGWDPYSGRKQELRETIASLQSRLALEEESARLSAEQQKRDDAANRALDWGNQLLDRGLSKQQELNKALAEAQKMFDARESAGTPFSIEQKEKIIAQIKEEHKDTEALAAARRRDAEAQREQEKLQREQNRLLEQQEKAYQKLTDQLDPVGASYRKFITDQETLNDAYERGRITVSQYLNLLDQLKASQNSNQTASQAYSGGFGSEIGSRGGIGAPTDPNAVQSEWDEWLKSAENAFTDFDNLNRQAAESFTQGFGNAIEGMVFDFDNLGSAASSVLEGIGRTAINTMAQMAAQSAIQAAFTASSWAPAAAATSISTFGGAVAAGMGALSGVASQALSIFKFADGGYVSGPGSSRSDSIPAMLSNGEYVVNAQATRQHRPMLEAINSNRIMSAARSDASAGSGGQGGGNNVTVPVTINNQFRDAAVSTRRDENGGLTIDIVKAELAKDFRTNGQVAQAGQQNFKWQRTGR